MEFHLSSQNLLSNPIIEMCNLLINKLFVAYYPLKKIPYSWLILADKIL